MSEHPGGEIILYQRSDAPAIDVPLDGDTVWLGQQQLADLFQLCPEGVECKELGGLLERTSNIRWQDAQGEKFKYINPEPVDLFVA